MVFASGNGHDVTLDRERRAKQPVAPERHGAVALQRQTMVAAGRDGHHVVQIGGRSALAIRVVAPADHGAIRFESQTVILAGGNGDHRLESGWWRGLLIGVRAPGNDRSVGLQGKAMIPARRDGNNLLQLCGEFHLPVGRIVIAPARHFPVFLQGKLMTCTGGNRGQMVELWRWIPDGMSPDCQ